MQRLTVLALAMLGAVGIALLSSSYFGEASANADTTQGQVAFDSREWIDTLRRGGEIEFVRESATPGEAPSTALIVESLGPIAASSIEDLVMHLGVEPSAVALANATTKAESGAPEDFVAFLNERYCYEKVRLAVDKTRSGDYVTLAMGSSLPRLPEGYVCLGQIGASSVGAKQVDVWFLFDLAEEKHGALRQMKSELEEASALLLDEEVLQFNLLPLEERKSRISLHLASAEAMRNVAPGPNAIEERRSLQTDLLPNKFVIDSKRSLVSRRIIQYF